MAAKVGDHTDEKFLNSTNKTAQNVYHDRRIAERTDKHRNVDVRDIST